MNAHARTSAGFTLLELLIAIALFALLGLGTYRMLEAVLQSDEAVRAQELQLQFADAVVGDPARQGQFFQTPCVSQTSSGSGKHHRRHAGEDGQCH